MLDDEIVTQRLKLRLFRFSDVPAMHAYLQDPEIGTYLEGSGELPSIEEVSGYIAHHLLVDRNQRDVWAITIDDLVVGGGSINYRKECLVAEVGYSIKKALWGQGYAREALTAIVNRAFTNCPGLQRIQATIDPRNTGSIRVVESVGMKLEGTMRASCMVRGALADESIYAILRSEWLATAR